MTMDTVQPTTLILVRHAESLWNSEGRVQGQLDAAITARGRDQAESTARRLAAAEMSAVYSSDMSRATQTAQPIAAPHSLELQIRADLRERSFGILEGKTMDEAARDDTGWFQAWRADRLRLAPPDGETQPEMAGRTMAALRDIAARHPGESVAVVTHGGPIKSAVFTILDVPLSSWMRTWIANCSITILRAAPRLLQVVSFNDTSHLDPEPTPTWRTSDIGEPS